MEVTKNHVDPIWDRDREHHYSAFCREAVRLLEFCSPRQVQLLVDQNLAPGMSKRWRTSLDGIAISARFSRATQIFGRCNDLSYSAQGRVTSSGRIDGVWTCRKDPVVLDGSAMWDQGHLGFQVVLQQGDTKPAGNQPRGWFNELDCGRRTNGSSWVGIKSIYHLGIGARTWSMGGELYYLPGSRHGTGSMGFGTRLFGEQDSGSQTVMVDPIMGHVSCMYLIDLQREIKACSKYDFNIYSLESNVSFGLELVGRQFRSNFRWGLRQGLGLLYQFQIHRHVWIKLGFESKSGTWSGGCGVQVFC